MILPVIRTSMLLLWVGLLGGISDQGPTNSDSRATLPSLDAQLSHGGHSHAGSNIALSSMAKLPTVTPHPPAGSTIPWRSARRLEWKDFRGQAQPETGVDAVSSCGIRCDPVLRRDGGLTFTVSSYFSHFDSWVDMPDASAYLLQHEQRHFDLGELYARKLRYKLTKTRFDRGRLNAQIRDHYNEVFAAYRKAQGVYDSETAHSTDLQAQERWQQWIDSELHRYRAYTSPNVRAVGLD